MENLRWSEKVLERLIVALEGRGYKKHGRATRIAEITGYSVSQVSDVLAGKVALSERFLSVVCSKIGLSESAIKTGIPTAEEDHAKYGVTGVVRKITPDMEKLLELLEGVPLDPDVIAELGRNADAREMMENYIRLPKSRQKRRLGDVIADREELEKEKD